MVGGCSKVSQRKAVAELLPYGRPLIISSNTDAFSINLGADVLTPTPKNHYNHKKPRATKITRVS